MWQHVSIKCPFLGQGAQGCPIPQRLIVEHCWLLASSIQEHMGTRRRNATYKQLQPQIIALFDVPSGCFAKSLNQFECLAMELDNLEI